MVAAWGGEGTALTLVLKPYRDKTRVIKRHPRRIAPRAIPSITTKISLLGLWRTIPRCRGAADADDREEADAALEPRLDG